MPDVTPGGLPFPLATDPLADGAAAIEALAEAVDAKIAAIPPPPATTTIRHGVAALNWNANRYSTDAPAPPIYHSMGRPPAAIFICGVDGFATYLVQSGSINDYSFAVIGDKGVVFTGTQQIYWVAFGAWVAADDLPAIPPDAANVFPDWLP